jgi:hypothetical protein
MTSRRDILKSAGLSFLSPNSFFVASKSTPVQTTKQPVRHSATRFGLNLHIDRFSDEAAFLQLAIAKSTGIQSIRGLEANLARIEPRPGQWSFDKVDRDLALFEEFGFEAIGLMGYGVAWASAQDPNHAQNPPSFSFFPPDDSNIWEEYVQRVVERYHEKIHVWAPWNEPDNFGFFMSPHAGDMRNPEWVMARRQKFLEIQQLTYTVTKRIDPNTVVLSGAFSLGGDYDNDFLPWLIEHGLLDFCDALDIHNYWGIKFLESTVTGVRDLMKKAGKLKPIWFTEFGAGLRKDQSWIGPFGFDQIASLAVKAVATAAALRLEGLFWYEGFTEGPDPITLEDPGLSLSVTDGPTPAYWSFSTAVQLLRGVRFDGPVKVTGGSAKGYRFSIGRRKVMILWALSPDGLDNRSAAAKCQFSWRGRNISIALSDRPTVLTAG